MGFPSLVEAVQLSGVLLHLVVSAALIVSLFFWHNIAKSGSRMGFTTTAVVINIAMTVEWAIRLRDVETHLRTDGIEVFPPMPLVSLVVLASASIGLAAFTRFKCLDVAPSILWWSIFGSVFLTIAVKTSSDSPSWYSWVMGSFGLFLTGLQAWAWTLVPDTINPPGTKDKRRTDAFSWFMVACYTIFLVATPALILVGNSMTGWIDSDSLLYAALNLGLRSIALPVVFPLAGIFFYWNDISLPGDEARSD